MKLTFPLPFLRKQNNHWWLKIHTSTPSCTYYFGPFALDARHQKGLETATKSCLIHNTLTHSPKIVTQITSTSMLAS
jgi:hypothetical protein